MEYRDTHVMVTGGSSGIGRALVGMLVDRGARVSILALDDADLKTVAEEYSDRLRTVSTHPVDVTDLHQVTAAVDEATELLGFCRLLITSAGISRPGRFLELDDEHFVRLMDVNYFGTLHAIRAVTPRMVELGVGGIVAISSAAGLLGVYGYSAYGATKYAVRGLCEVLRTELKPHGIYVGCVYPTDVDTPQLAGEQPFLPDETRAISGTIRPIPAEKVARAILAGVDRKRADIFTDPTTMILDRLVRTAPGLTRRWLDSRVARARRTA